MRKMLRSGDVLCWINEDGFIETFEVSEDGSTLTSTRTGRAWDEDPLGYTPAGAEQVLEGKARFDYSGRIYKCYDNATDAALWDPELDTLP